MKRKRKQLMAYLLSAAMAVTSLLGFSKPAMVVSEAAVYNGDELVLQNPVIQEDDSLSAGQAVIYDCIYFGSYPQAEVITAKMSKNYTAINSAYYNEEKDVVISDDVYAELQEATDWDSNGDIVIDGKKYRRMKQEDETETKITVTTPAARYQWEDSDTYHYFQYQPIKWRILNVENSHALLHADIALDFQNYHNYKENITWMMSTLKKWISNEFINYAFNDEEQRAIISSTVENRDNLYYGTSGGFSSTEKVFVLSESEVYDTANAESYGYTSGKSILDEARRRKSSTYAKAKGVYSIANGNCVWWLRSPGIDQTWAVSVLGNGTVNYYGTSVYAASAVCPALYLDLSYDSLYTYAGTVCTDEESEETQEIKREEADEAAIVDSGMPLQKIKISPKETQVVRGDTKVIKLKNVVSWNKAKGRQKKVSWTIKNKNKVIKKSVKGKYNQRLKLKVKRLGTTTVTAKFNGKKYTATVSGVKTITREDGEDEDEDGEEEPAEDVVNGDDYEKGNDSIVYPNGFNLRTSGYSLTNDWLSFCYPSKMYNDEIDYKISIERYKEVFGDSITQNLYNQHVSIWNGNCFGMSATSTLFHKNMLHCASYPAIEISDLNDIYDKAFYYDGDKDFPQRLIYGESEITKIIEQYQIWQMSKESTYLQRESISKLADIQDYNGFTSFMATQDDKSSMVTMFKNVINGIQTSQEPYMLSVYWDTNKIDDSGNAIRVGHAMVVDSSRGVQKLSSANSYYEKEGWYRIYLYDPNNPYWNHYNKGGILPSKEEQKDALNRYINININTGEWQIKASINETIHEDSNIGYDDNGNCLKNSTIVFYDVNSFPADFDTKATYFWNESGSSCITYSCNDFNIIDVDGKEVFAIENGCIVYQNTEKVELIINTGITNDWVLDNAQGRLILTGSGYTVNTNSQGVIAFMEDNVYKGCNVNGNMTLTDSDTSGITISAQDDISNIHIVLETVSGDKYVSVGTDVDVNGNLSTFTLKDNEFIIDTTVDQILDVNVNSDDLGDYQISNIDTSKVISVDVKSSNSITIKDNDPDTILDSPAYNGDGENIISEENTFNSVDDYFNIGNLDGEISKDGFSDIPYKEEMEFIDNASKAVYKITRYTENDRTVEYVKPISKNVTRIVIPAKIEVDGMVFKVTSIAGKAFYKNKKLKQVVIGKNVQTIGNKAFYGCKNLVILTIKTQKLVKSRVGRDAFSKVNPKAVVKVPGRKLNSYTKLLIDRGLSKKTKIRK